MKVKIQDEEYEMKLKADEISLYDYLTIGDIYNIDEEDMDQDTKDLEVIRHLSDLHPKYYGEPKLIKYFIDKINDNIAKIAIPKYEDKLLDKYSYKEPSEWVFYQWVLYESFFNNGYTYKGEQLNGQYLYLPLIYSINGEFDEKLLTFDDKIDEILYKTPFYKVFEHHNNIINTLNKIKENHYYVYMYEGGGAGNNPNLKHHNEVFGWLETMRDLSEKGVFGTYLELKKAPLFDVLAFLNVQISRSVAESDDMLLNKNKK